MPFSSKNINDNLFQVIFNSGMIGLLFTTFDGKIVEANDAFLDFIGYSREDLLNGKIDWRKITPSEFQTISDKAIHNLKTKGFCSTYEKEYFKKDGSRVRILMGSVRVQNADDYDCMTYAIDVSERTKFEKELALSKEQLESRVKNRTKDLSEANTFLSSIFENIPNMIFVKEAQSLRFVRFNKAGEDLLGLKRSDLIGKNDYDFFPKEEADFFVKKDLNVLQNKTTVDIPEEPITTKFGARVLHTKKIPILDEEGKPKYLLGISEDITDRKKAEQERHKLIREQAARGEAERNVYRLELLSDASTLLASTLDFENTLKNFYDFIVSRMAEWCQVAIYPNEAKSIQGCIYETSPLAPQVVASLKAHQWKLIKNIDDALESGSNDKETLKNLKKLKFKSVINVPLKVRESIIGHILLASPTKNFRLMDLQLVEEVAEKASLSIENARLFSEAQKANRLKDEFLATLSHELRTPLNIIHGYAELLKNFSDRMTEKEKIDGIDAIYRNAIDQTNIVNDILDVSRIITGKMSVSLSLLPPADTILAVAKNTVRMAEVKNVNLITDLPKTPIYIMMDPTRMQQIIWNLVSNAIKFTPEGGSITIKNYQEDNNCIITVEDTGIGINPSFLPHMFERFRQEDGSMTRKYGGLGLGLAIVRHLVEMHGGSVSAHSEGKDQGSKFTIKIPIPANAKIQNQTKKIQRIDNSLSNLKVLLIEDSRDNRLLITRLLSNYGAHVMEAESAQVGRKILRNYEPDIILCDIGMPDETGLEFIKKFRKSDKQTPAIALTAYAREEEKEKFLKTGFQAHVAKPVSVPSLLSEIKKLV